MESITSFGIESGGIAAQIAFLFWVYKALTSRVDKLESEISRKLNNGIRSEINEMKIEVARMGERSKQRRRGDEQD